MHTKFDRYRIAQTISTQPKLASDNGKWICLKMACPKIRLIEYISK